MWKNINNPEQEISNHHYKKLSDEEKVNWYNNDLKKVKPTELLNILSGSLLGGDSDKTEKDE